MPHLWIAPKVKVEVLDMFGDKQQKIERISSGHHRSIPSASQNNIQNSFSRNQLHVPDPKYSKTLLEIDEADLQSRYVNRNFKLDMNIIPLVNKHYDSGDAWKRKTLKCCQSLEQKVC